MNSYKVKGIILAVIISLASIMMPFSVYADTIDSHIRGRNYTYEPITYNEIQLTQNTYYQNIGVFHITFELDDEYIGYVLPNYSIQYDNYFYGAQTPNWGTLTKSFDRRIFINGSSFSFDITVNWYSININSAPGDDPFNYDSYTITSSDVTKYADIDSLDQIINILNDLYNSNDQVEGLLNDQLTQLQLVVSNTSLANQYLEIISELKEYKFPFESFSFISYQLASNKSIVDYYSDNVSYIYPRFKITNSSTNKRIADVSFLRHESITMIIMVSASSVISSTSFTINGGTLESTEILNYYRDPIYGYTYLYKFIFTGTSNLRIDYSESFDMVYIPIYCGYAEKLSTEFALTFGMSNELLDNVKLIAQGSTQSNSAASDLEQEASEYSDIADDVIGVEEGLTSNFESSVNQIDLNTGLNGFGGNFMTSATWVRTQFDRLTENTPYGSLVVYGLTLGFVLLMLGKVLL